MFRSLLPQSVVVIEAAEAIEVSDLHPDEAACVQAPAPAAVPSARTPVTLRAPSVRAEAFALTLLDRTIPPTSFDIGFSPNPCPRKPGALYR